MVWPISQDYNEAIQDPASSFADPELKQGEASAADLAIMALIDRQYLARPYYGSRRMSAWLATQGHRVSTSGSSG